MDFKLAWEELKRRAGSAVDRRLLSSGVAHRALLLARLGNTSDPSMPVSGEELAAALGVSRAAVHKHVAFLRELGLEIKSSKGIGYRLISSGDDLLAAETVAPYLLALQDPAAGPVVGLPYRYLKECSSTNEMLKRAALGAPPGTVLVTDRQTAGRGRLERSWFSQPGKDLTFSVIFHPCLLPAQAHLLSLAAALAVAEVLEKLLGRLDVVKIKWPNDVLLAGKKVCGILLEGSLDTDRLQWVIVGVGLNVNSDPALLARGIADKRPDEWQGKPAPVSLRAFASKHFPSEGLPRAPLLAALLTRLGERCGPLAGETLAGAAFLEEIRARDALAGREVEVLAGSYPSRVLVAGKAAGIGAEGQLLVKRASGGVTPVFAGDVVVRAPGHWEGC